MLKKYLRLILKVIQTSTDVDSKRYINNYLLSQEK